MRPYVPGGVAIDRSVGTMPRPLAGITISAELHKSNPAASEDPFLGRVAFSERRLTRRDGSVLEFDIIVRDDAVERKIGKSPDDFSGTEK